MSIPQLNTYTKNNKYKQYSELELKTLSGVKNIVYGDQVYDKIYFVDNVNRKGSSGLP